MLVMAGNEVFDHTEFFKDYTYCGRHIDRVYSCCRSLCSRTVKDSANKFQGKHIAGRKNATNTKNEHIDENAALPVNEFADSVQNDYPSRSAHDFWRKPTRGSLLFGSTGPDTEVHWDIANCVN